MARLLTTGFETGDLGDIYLNPSYCAVGTSSPSPKTGGYRLGVHWSDGYSDFRGWTPTSEIYGHVAVYHQANISNLLFVDNSNNILIKFVVNNGGFVVAYVGGSSVATGTHISTALQWNSYEFHIKIADSGGRIELRLNGALDIDYTGDTKPGSNDIANLRLWGHDNWNYYDDIVINDTSGSYNNTWPGVVKLEAIRPNAAGDVTQLTRGGSDSGSNYGQVDEVPASASDYVYESTVDMYDLYNMTTTTLPAGAVVKNIVGIAYANIDSGSGNMAIMTKNGSTETTGATQALGSVARPFEEAWAKNPADSGDWEQSDIDSIQIGVKVK